MNKMSLTRDVKAKVAKTVSLQLSHTQAEAVVEATIDAITDALSRGESVKLLGFGTFSVRVKQGRVCKLPNKNDPIKVPDSKVIKFNVGKSLKELINASSKKSSKK